MEYWSWWVGATALGLFAVVYGLVAGKPLGVSGSWMRVVNWRSDKELKEAEAFFKENQDEAIDDLMAETLAEFGEGAADEINEVSAGDVETGSAKKTTNSSYTPAGAHFVFLIAMVIGSFITAMLNGGFEIKFELSELHSSMSGQTWEMWLGLLFGGIMVGFGTQMAGGCTSGHGLSGCSQFVPASLFATFVFMASAVGFSLFMKLTS